MRTQIFRQSEQQTRKTTIRPQQTGNPWPLITAAKAATATETKPTKRTYLLCMSVCVHLCEAKCKYCFA